MKLISEDVLGKMRRASLAPYLLKKSLAPYEVIVSTGAGCDFYKFIWESCAPPKVKFFGCRLLVQNCIQTKENLLKKHCLDEDTCEVGNAAVESVAHLIVRCCFSSGFWHRIDIEMVEDNAADLWNVCRRCTF
jgi:hypothetical protein